MKLILASSSPRRAEILRHAGFVFDVRPAHVDETRLPREKARDYVRRLAAAKAEHVANHGRWKNHAAIVIGADTVVVAKGKILGKPVDVVHVEKTRVTFARLPDEEIDRYLLTGEPFHKAGAYAIQGIAGRYVTRIEGCYFNVVGLPLARLSAMLAKLGWRETR
jgi:septum formation protein